MSEEDKSYTAVLLPSATVALYTVDDESKAAFQSLEDDWRFARVTLEVFEGDVDAAIKAYQETESPDLVIVQTESIDEAFSGQLEALSGHCAEGTSAIVIGPVNDVNLYRKLVGMGVSDYLVRPVDTKTLGNDIGATLLDQIGARESRLIAFMGAKGGQGVTVLAEALAWGVSDKLDQKTFLLDTAGGWSTLSVGLDFEPSTTLNEAVRVAVEGNEDSLSRMIFKASEKLSVLSSGGDVMLDDSVAPDKFEILLDYLMAIYPVVIVDLSASTSALRRMVLTKAHEICLVATPTLPSVRATRTLLQEIKELRGNSDEAVDVIVNMQGLAPKHEVLKGQIEDGIERKPAAIISYEPDLFIRTESEAKKLLDDKAGAEIVDKLLPLARKLLAGTGSDTVNTDAEASTKGALGQFLDKLKAKS